MSEYVCPKDCPDRDAVCHIYCQTHKLYREEVEAERKKRHQEVIVNCYQTDQKLKAIEITKHHKTWKRRKRNK